MLIDNLTVFSDNVSVAAGNSNVVEVMPFFGKGNPVNVTVCVTKDVNNLTALNVKLQQADSAAGAFTDTGAGLNLTLKDLQAGRTFRFVLPDNAIQPFLRLNYTVTGTAPSAGKLFAALTLDSQLPYEPGQMVRQGRVL